jgi:glycosyltransferase involved in cell wall biosynthesis
MKVLILNWRDPKNPMAGGAEKLNYQILKVFIDRGDEVIWYGKSVEGLQSKENYKGIEIIRFGNIFTHLLAWPFFIITKKFGNVDLVIDCIHGIGYFTPLFMPRTKKKILIYEVAQNIWDEMFTFPISSLGKFLEKLMFRLIYFKSKFWTISKSTHDDLVKMGLKARNIKVIPMGFDAPSKIKKSPKFKEPTALFVGRLVEMKGIKDALNAVSDSKKWNLRIIGRGTEGYEKELRAIVEKLDIQGRVNFLGFVSEEDKFEEMSKAWVLLVPSSREGWGMIVGEANYAGTQVIGYNSPGLKDSIPFYSKQNIVVNNYEEMAESLAKINEPLKFSPELTPGWSNLYSFVAEELKIKK